LTFILSDSSPKMTKSFLSNTAKFGRKATLLNEKSIT
jgi:hypothetical protein